MNSEHQERTSRTSSRRRVIVLALVSSVVAAFGATVNDASAARVTVKSTKACAKNQTRDKSGKCVASVVTTRAGTTASSVAATPNVAPPAVATTAPSTTGAPGVSAQRDKLVVAYPNEPDQLDEYVGEHRFEGAQMMDTLMIRDKKTGVISPWLLSERPKALDPFQQDWELKLRTDVTFHDGTPLTAQHIVDIVNYAKGVRGITELAGATRVNEVTTVSASNANTVKISFSAPQPLLTGQLVYFVVPKVVNGRVTSIGTGPFQLQEWSRGQRFIMRAYDKYWGPKPNVKTIEMKYIPDPAARLAAVLAGEVDVMTNVSVEDSSRVPTVVASDSSLQFYRIQLNNRDGVTADVRVRQALNYAIDKEGMIKAFFNGQAAIDNCQSLAPGMTGYNPGLKPYPYDPAKAKALIKEAGADGMKIEIYQAADRWSKGLEIVQAVAQMWGAVGIQTTVRNVPFTQWLEVAQRQPGPRPDSFFVGANLRLQDAIDLRGYLTSDPRIGTISSVSDPIIDKMLVDFGAIDEETARDKAFQTLTAKICRDATFAYLFAPKILTGLSKGISFTPDPRNDRWYKVSEFVFAR